MKEYESILTGRVAFSRGTHAPTEGERFRPLNDTSRVAALLHGPGDLRLARDELPATPEPRHVRLLVSHCGICGSDTAYYQGQRNAVFPMRLGHEYCGVIEAIGLGVDGFREGGLVVVEPNYRCGNCRWCRRGQSHFCQESPRTLAKCGLATRVDVRCEHLISLPSMRRQTLGALVEPLSCALHAIGLIGRHRFTSTLIVGCGSLGSLVAFALRAQGRDTEITVRDANPARAGKLKEVADAHVLDVHAATTAKADERQFDLVFEASTDASGLGVAASRIAKGGQIIVMSRFDRAPDLPLPVRKLQRQEVTLRWSHLNGNGQTMLTAIPMLARWDERWDQLIAVEPLTRIGEAFHRARDRDENKTIIDCQSDTRRQLQPTVTR